MLGNHLGNRKHFWRESFPVYFGWTKSEIDMIPKQIPLMCSRRLRCCCSLDEIQLFQCCISESLKTIASINLNFSTYRSLFQTSKKKGWTERLNMINIPYRLPPDCQEKAWKNPEKMLPFFDFPVYFRRNNDRFAYQIALWVIPASPMIAFLPWIIKPCQIIPVWHHRTVFQVQSTKSISALVFAGNWKICWSGTSTNFEMVDKFDLSMYYLGFPCNS